MSDRQELLPEQASATRFLTDLLTLPLAYSAARTFVEDALGPVLEYDQKKRGELMVTLQAYFRSDSLKDAADQLPAHPHTVTYRMKVVHRLTGLSYLDAEARFTLRLAVRTWEALQ